MPRFMLNANMCIYLTKDQPQEVSKRFAHCYAGDAVISIITHAELEYGVVVSVRRSR